MKCTQTFSRNKDFRRLYARGKSFVHPVLVTYTIRNGGGPKRMGITASTKVGNAVTRNRAKRVIKEAYRQLEPSVPAGWDFVFVARTKTSDVKMPAVKAAMAAQLKKAGVMK